MARYVVTTRSTVYSVYEVEAETEQEARIWLDNQYNLEPMNERSEDTDIYDIELDEEEGEE